MVADSGKIAAMDLVEVNPIFDNRNHTAEFGAELILSAFGKSIFLVRFKFRVGARSIRSSNTQK
jgi:hypothetical protein